MPAAPELLYNAGVEDISGLAGRFAMAHRHRCMVAGGAFLLFSLWSPPAQAQTRTEEITKKQEEKARDLKPYEMNKAEIFFEQVEQGKWFLGVPRGWYPMVSAVGLGGGLAAGGGYRHYIGYDSYVDAGALYSIAGYKRIHITGFTPDHFSSRVDFSGQIGWTDSTRLAFYGLGQNSDPADRTNYRITRLFVEGAAVLRPARWLRLRLDGGVDDYAQEPGRGRFPSIEQRFTPDTAPLLGEEPRYLRGEVSAAVHWLQSPRYSRRGGLYRFAYEEFNPLRGNGGTFGFIHTEVVQHIPILRETWVVSVRARTDSIVRKSDVVPYFLMPALGGGDTLRGYATSRFVDRHTLLFSGEFRWFPNRLGLDMALFFDAGKVAPFRSRLTFTNMKTDYGLGVRFHTPTATALRFDLARGSEGWRLVFSASSPF
jgi:hypothetical protein